jgi:hypothetical protein
MKPTTILFSIIVGVFSILALIAGVFVAVVMVKSSTHNARAQDSQTIVEVWRKYNSAITSANYLDSDGAQKTSWLKLADLMAEIDCSKCPLDFQEAWKNLVTDTSNFATHANTVTAITGGIDLLRAKTDTITSLNERKAKMESSQIECKRIAAQHGCVFTSK